MLKGKMEIQRHFCVYDGPHFEVIVWVLGFIPVTVATRYTRVEAIRARDAYLRLRRIRANES